MIDLILFIVFYVFVFCLGNCVLVGIFLIVIDIFCKLSVYEVLFGLDYVLIELFL